MFGNVSERSMHAARWVLTCGWLLLIVSLFYDPITPHYAPLPDRCVLVQGQCLSLEPYAIAPSLFWGMIVPIAILMLLVYGHELWRRICPLSFLSQLPRALKIQRQWRRIDAKTGKVRYELPKVKADSWLGKHYPYLQCGLLFIGLCSRILFINGDRLALGLWLLGTIGAAISVGYLYGGKTWCNYFCPMAPVQQIYAEPGGLFASRAHVGDRLITQSMCRTILPDGKEQSACVACKNPCIDIDAERSYWETIGRPEQKVLYYGYVGLVFGYFIYYYLYAGNWEYYFSGAWAMRSELDGLFAPGFYFFDRAVPIPKLLAVPLTLGLFTGAGYWLGRLAEQYYERLLEQRGIKLTAAQRQNHLFAICTYLAFNFFFIFGGRPFLQLLPVFWQALFDGVILTTSTLWLAKTWWRSPDTYMRESLANRFRKQLHKLALNVPKLLEGRSLEDLNPHEVYVLAKVLPGFTREKRCAGYKGVLREALQEGNVNSVGSLEVLRQMRVELDISDEEHRQILEELGVEDPSLLDPSQKRDLENLVRLNGYRSALDRLLHIQNLVGTASLSSLQREYAITPGEESAILLELDRDASLENQSRQLLNMLRDRVEMFHAFNQPILRSLAHVMVPLRAVVRRKKHPIVTRLLVCLRDIGDRELAEHVARELAAIAPSVLPDILADPTSDWLSVLPASLRALLQESPAHPACSLDISETAMIAHLQALLSEPTPAIVACALFVLFQLEGDRERARPWSHASDPLLRETATAILQAQKSPLSITLVPQLEKFVHLFASDFFQDLAIDTLLELTHRATVASYGDGEAITEAGDTCRELLLLMEGIVELSVRQPDGKFVTSSLLPGCVLDELEVLSHSDRTGQILARSPTTRVLAIPVAALDDVLERDRHFARRILQLESRRLQQLLEQTS